MFQKILILRKWEEAGLKQSPKKKVRDFIKFVEKNPKLGWDACVKEFYKKYDDVFNDLIPPLLSINDNLIIFNLLRFMEPRKRRKELNLLKHFAKTADTQKLQPALEAVAKLKIPSVNKVLQARNDLPHRLRAILVEPKNP